MNVSDAIDVVDDIVRALHIALGVASDLSALIEQARAEGRELGEGEMLLAAERRNYALARLRQAIAGANGASSVP